MGFTVIPTNIGGVSLNSIASPLAALLGGTSPINNLIFPSDLGSNPALGHAVIIQAYDYTTKLGLAVKQAGQAFTTAVSSSTNEVSAGVSGIAAVVKSLGPESSLILEAAAYEPQKQQTPYATISLYMPDTQAINYETHYEEVSLTKELGIPGMLAHAWSDMKSGQLKNTGAGYATSTLSGIGGTLAGLVGGGNAESLGKLAAQGAGIVQNPQIQLLFNSVSLRTFQLEFMLTPKSSNEAQTVKNICDSFAFYSLPGIAGAQQGQAGQFLTPPQIFSVQFQFLGNSGMLGQISNTLQSALNTTGLNTLFSNGGITGGTPAKTFSVNDCVLESVNVDYAPNGWAAYQDGYPVQTRLTLQFKETTMITKNQFKNSSLSSNFTDTQQVNSVSNVDKWGK